MQMPQIVTNMKDQATFSQELLEALLKEKFTKVAISKETGMSISTVNRVLLGKTKAITSKHFKNLISFYCWVKLEKENSEMLRQAEIRKN